MEIYERIRELRKNHLKISMESFGNRVGVSRDTINNIEHNRLARPEQKLSLYKLICSEFNVNEDWLLNGNEPMFVQPKTFSLDQFVQERGATDLELDILKAYFDLDPDLRKMLIEHFKKRISGKDVQNNNFDGVPATPEELEQEFPPVEPDNKSEVG